MKTQLTNAGYGVLDYLSYPAGMLLVAPIVLHKLGAAEYGLWMIATSVISVGGIVASGFGDACIQRVAQLRGSGEVKLLPETVRSMLAVNTALGVLLAIAVWFAAPMAANHIAVSQLAPEKECLLVLRVASAAIVLRAMESVAVGGQRAFEQYRDTVQISTAMRIATLATAAGIAWLGGRMVAVLTATCVFLAWGAFAQFARLRSLLGNVPLWPGIHRQEIRILLGRGFAVWLQALGGVVFGQLDRILLGIALGAVAVSPYSLCVQFAHPIYGLSASGLNFLFPYLSNRANAIPGHMLRGTVAKVFVCNFAMVAAGAALLLVWGDWLIRIWAGPAVAESAKSILPPVVVGSALMGLSVTGTYALQALGEFHTVAGISLGGRAVMLVAMIEMLHSRGLYGLAMSRMFLGVIALAVYLPLFLKLKPGNWERENARLDLATGAPEVAEP